MINKEYIKYLSGEMFSSGLKFKVNLNKSDMDLEGRISKIVSVIEGKNILHIGCVDHLPLIKEKIKKNEWLHKILTNKSNKCLGIDINKDGIIYLQNELGYDNVMYHNLLSDDIPIDIQNTNWDYMILGEILEHVDNPVEFLSQIHKNYSQSVKKLLITVPNAFRYQNYDFAKNNIEHINTDHRYWFTPYTASKIATLSGFKVDKISFAQISFPSRWHFIKKFKIIKYPMLRDTIIMELFFNE